MNNYEQAVQNAVNNVADVKQRGKESMGSDVLDFLDSLMTPEEIAESDFRAAIIDELIKAR